MSPDISNEPNEPTPVVVIAEAPLSIAPNPDVILPAFNAPVDVKPVAVVIEFCVAVATVPVRLPVTSPVNAPIKPVAVILPVLGLGHITIGFNANCTRPSSTCSK